MLKGDGFVILDTTEQTKVIKLQKVQPNSEVSNSSGSTKYQRIIKKVGITLSLIFFAVFSLILIFWISAPDFIAYIIISSFIFGILLLIAHKPIGSILFKLKNGWSKKHWLVCLIILVILIALGIYKYKNWYIPKRNLKNGFVIVNTFNCPQDHPIKAHLGSMIYHVRGGTYYNRTNAANGYCFDTVGNAKQQGFRGPYN